MLSNGAMHCLVQALADITGCPLLSTFPMTSSISLLPAVLLVPSGMTVAGRGRGARRFWLCGFLEERPESAFGRRPCRADALDDPLLVREMPCGGRGKGLLEPRLGLLLQTFATGRGRFFTVQHRRN